MTLKGPDIVSQNPDPARSSILETAYLLTIVGDKRAGNGVEKHRRPRRSGIDIGNDRSLCFTQNRSDMMFLRKTSTSSFIPSFTHRIPDPVSYLDDILGTNGLSFSVVRIS
jgi:hypothetical protein